MSKKETYPRFSWEEYGQLLGKLSTAISHYLHENNLSVNAVVPIMRGGGFPGTYLAYKLHVLSIFPVHYHYDFRQEGKMRLRRLVGIKRYRDLIPESPVILLVEGNQCFGNTANEALQDIRTHVKKAKVLYAADLVDHGHKGVVKANAVFYGAYTNECETLSPEEAKEKGVFPTTKLLPWELDKEERETLETKQFRYNDLDHYFALSKIAKEIDL